MVRNISLHSGVFGVSQWKDVLILFSDTPWGQFCSEWWKHSIVNRQSFRILWLETPQPVFKTSILSAITSPWITQNGVKHLTSLRGFRGLSMGSLNDWPFTMECFRPSEQNRPQGVPLNKIKTSSPWLPKHCNYHIIINSWLLAD